GGEVGGGGGGGGEGKDGGGDERVGRVKERLGEPVVVDLRACHLQVRGGDHVDEQAERRIDDLGDDAVGRHVAQALIGIGCAGAAHAVAATAGPARGLAGRHGLGRH